ncbi:MAG: flagellar motor switch protein FliN [Silvanigrellaceae bacterium]
MEDNNQGFSPEDFGLESKAGADSGTSESSSLHKYGDDNAMSRVDLSRMKMVLDVPLKVTVELGRTKLLVNDLLQLGQGSVIELDKMAGEPMEIYVNDKLVAMGEVVVVNEKFGVRLTDVMSGLGIEDVHPPEAV